MNKYSMDIVQEPTFTFDRKKLESVINLNRTAIKIIHRVYIDNGVICAIYDHTNGSDGCTWITGVIAKPARC